MSQQPAEAARRRGLHPTRSPFARNQPSGRLGWWSTAAAGLALGVFGLFAYFVTTNGLWEIGLDANTYFVAAERLRVGETPYTDVPALHPGNYYRYAPWLAALFVPFTVLPRELVVTGFSLFALVCAGLVLLPLFRPLTLESAALLLLIGPALINFSWFGNVQAPLVAAVMYLPGRWAWIALAASLKFTPLALILPDVAARRWQRVALCVGLTAVLIAPMFAFDLSRYVTDTQAQAGTWDISPLLTFGLGAAGATVTLAISRHRPILGLLAAATTVILASPYMIVAYLSWLLVPLRDSEPTAGAFTTGDP